MKRVILLATVVMISFSSLQHVYPADKLSLKAAPLMLPGEGTTFFCGYCHILTYPKIIKKAHNSWKTDKHKDVSCKTCHYAPVNTYLVIPEHERILREDKTAQQDMKSFSVMKEIQKETDLEALSKRLTALNMDESVVMKKPKIDNWSCLTSKCHGSKEDKFMTKKIKLTEKITYIHEPHFNKDKWIEGQEIHCTTCHQHETGKKHFEVSMAKCILCHIKNAKFNEGRAKCSLCHEIPTKPLQRQKKEGAKADEKPITHQSIEKAKVPCQSCHLHLIQGDGAVDEEKCLDCHDNEKSVMKEAANKKLMHKEHVAGQNAGCFNCHGVIELKERDFIDPAREACTACHPDHHKYQKMLLIGAKRPGVSKMPGLMSAVDTNCLACHTDEKLKKGEIVAQGSGKTCAACHTEKHEGMAKEWKDKTTEELKNAREVEQEALDTIKNARGTAPKKKIKEAMAMLKQGQGNIRIVEYGGGVHNKKYSIMLLDAAMNNFEDAIDLLSEEE